jgi:alpha-beta hydrolase superfamily lysophospholipase
MGIRRTEGSFEGSGGLSLFRRSWLCDSPERVLVLVHGFAEHSGRYEDLGAWFAARGCAVHGYDHRGHGRSQGARNFVVGIGDYLDDLGVLLEIVASEHPGMPVTIVGHSMGGLVSLAFAQERKPDIASLVTSGPALVLGPAMGGAKLVLLRLLRRLVPRMLLSSGLQSGGLSHDPEVARLYDADPLVDTRMTPGLGVAMTDAIKRTAGGGAEIEVPLLMLHGGDDPLCSPNGSQTFFDGLPAGAAPPSAIHIYPGLFHEIFNEPEKQEIFETVLGWVCEQKSNRASVATGAAPA